MLSDLFGKKRVFQVSCIFIVAASLIWTVARTMSHACIAGALMGIGGGVLEGMSSALLSDLFPDRRKLFLNLSQVFYCLGAVGGPILMGRLLPLGIPWQNFFLALGIMGIGLFILYTASTIPAPCTEERITFSKAKSLIGRWSFIAPCLVILCYVFTESCVVLYCNVYLRKHCQAPENWAIYSLGVFWLAASIGRVLCAAVPERYSYEKLIALLLLASGLAVAAQSLAPGWRTSFVLFSVTGFLFSGTWPMIVGLTASRNPGHSGTVVGLTIAVGALGYVAAAPAMNALFAGVAARNAFAIASLPLFVGSGIILLSAGSGGTSLDHNEVVDIEIAQCEL